VLLTLGQVGLEEVLRLSALLTTQDRSEPRVWVIPTFVEFRTVRLEREGDWSWPSMKRPPFAGEAEEALDVAAGGTGGVRTVDGGTNAVGVVGDGSGVDEEGENVGGGVLEKVKG
jgi:hypothetical protein